ncbi:MAG: hypothetical protein QM757_05535 [Paludibaculum sp.]
MGSEQEQIRLQFEPFALRQQVLMRIHQRHLVDGPAQPVERRGRSGQDGGDSGGEKGAALHTTGP